MRYNPLDEPYARAASRFLDLVVHTLITGAFALLIYFKFERLDYVAFAVFGGIFIDLDHFLDYLLYFKRFNLKQFLITPYGESKKAYILLHSWELVFILLITGFIFKYIHVLVLGFGMALHLLVDTLQRGSFLLYCLAYRFRHKFDVAALRLNL
ncbi:MAG: hypothetical protein JSW17_01005 [Candidatus Omnitrophota bacterium]|nr:MAG: hypothetical protein JSW17_01005 [Candidatus Omnitrophota bacterium]